MKRTRVHLIALLILFVLALVAADTFSVPSKIKVGTPVSFPVDI